MQYLGIVRYYKGDSTFVSKTKNGNFKVVGGSLEGNDNGIYLKDGGKTGELIGYSATPQSFYNSEEGKWMGTINPNDNSGRNFLNNDILKENPNIISYMWNATGGEKYDFKRTNGTDNVVFDTPEDFYRGMPILKPINGKQIYGSARDVGNIGAGLIAGINGLSWGTARNGFDALESYQKGKITTESSSTQYGQRLGWNIGNAIFRKSELSRLSSYGELRDIKIPQGYIDKWFRQK